MARREQSAVVSRPVEWDTDLADRVVCVPSGWPPLAPGRLTTAYRRPAQLAQPRVTASLNARPRSA